MRFLFLNQYGPPDSPPTARLLGELADSLRGRGHEVEIIARRESYQGRPARGGGRLKREAAALLGILRAGWHRRRPRPDVVLTLSSPPGLPVVGALLAWRHGARLAHWAMDLYPELALRLGEIRPGSVARAVGAAMRWAYRRSDLVVALDEDMRAHLQPFCRQPVRILEPWLSLAMERQLASADPVPLASAEPWIWLYSGNLGRAHEWRTLLDAQRLLEDRRLPIRLVFQGDGAARPEARAHSESIGLQRCEWKDYVAEDALLASLMTAQVLIVTQRPETRGLLWPSKLALLERLPKPILFVGAVGGAISQRLRLRGYAGTFPPSEAAAVADWIGAEFARHSAEPPFTPPPQPTVEQSCRTLEGWLQEL